MQAHYVFYIVFVVLALLAIGVNSFNWARGIRPTIVLRPRLFKGWKIWYLLVTRKLTIEDYRKQLQGKPDSKGKS
jgi:hypothetical protein